MFPIMELRSIGIEETGLSCISESKNLTTSLPGVMILLNSSEIVAEDFSSSL